MAALRTLFPPLPKQGSPQSAGSIVKCASFIFHHDKGRSFISSLLALSHLLRTQGNKPAPFSPAQSSQVSGSLPLPICRCSLPVTFEQWVPRAGPRHPHFSPANSANQASLRLIGATFKKQKGCGSLRILSGLEPAQDGVQEHPGTKAPQPGGNLGVSGTAAKAGPRAQTPEDPSPSPRVATVAG